MKSVAKVFLNVAVVTLISLASSEADVVTWDAGGSDTTLTTTANWNPNGAPAAGNAYVVDGSSYIAWIPQGTYTFAGDSLTIANGANLMFKRTNNANETTTKTINNLTINNATLSVNHDNTVDCAYTLNSLVTMTGADTINLQGNRGGQNILKLAGGVSGSGSITLTAAGAAGQIRQLWLSGNNSGYSGNWTITNNNASNTDILEVRHASGWGTGNMTITRGTGNGTELLFNSLDVSSPASRLTLTGAAARMDYNVTLGSLAGDAAAAVSIATGKTLTLSDATTTAAFAGAISGEGAVRRAGSGVLTLSGASSYSGGTILDQGTLVLGSATAIGTGALTINGGSLDSNTAGLSLTTGNQQNWNGDFSFLGTQDLSLGTGYVMLGGSGSTRRVTVNGAPLTVAGSIDGFGIGLTKAGSGTLILSSANLYRGDTMVNAGKLLLTGYHVNAGDYTVASGALLGGSTTFFIRLADSSKSVTVQAGGMFAPGAYGENTPFNIYDGALNLNDGAQLNYLLDTRLSITGSYFVGRDVTLGNGIVLNVTKGVGWGRWAYGETYLPLFNATDTLTPPSDFSTWSVTGADLGPRKYQFVIDPTNPKQVDLHVWTLVTGAWTNASGDGAWGTGDNWGVSIGTDPPNSPDATALFTDPAVTAGQVNLPASGATVGTISFASTTGGYTIAAATPATDKLTIKSSGGAAQILSSSGPHTILAPLVISSPTEVNITDPSSMLTLAGTVTAGGGNTITKLGSGTLKVDGGGMDTLAGVSSDIVIADGTLHLVDTTPAASNIQVSTSTGRLIAEITSGSRAINGVLSGPGTGTITKRGAGTLELGGASANTFSGTMTIEGGTVKINKTGAAAAIGGIVRVNGGATAGATLDLNGQSQTISQLAGSSGAVQGVVTSTAPSSTAILTITGPSTFEGLLQDGGVGSALGLSTSTADLVTFTSASPHNYSGPTTITGGVLQVDLPSASHLVLNGGVLQSNTFTSFTRALGAAGSTVEWAGTAGGGFAAKNNDLMVNIGGHDIPDTLVWGAASFVPNGSPLIFGSTSTDKTVEWQNPIQLTNGSAASQTIRVDGTAGGAAQARITGVLSDQGTTMAGTLIKSGTGTLALWGASTYTGGTIVQEGALEFANAAALPAGSNVTVGNGGVVIFSSGFSGPIGDRGASLSTSGVAAPPTTVPEPGTVALLLAGAAAMGVLIAQRRGRNGSH